MKRFRLPFLSVLFAIVLAAGASLALPAFAQGVDIATPTQSFADLAGLSTSGSAIEILARIVRFGLGLLGVVAVVIILWGGFVWMTSGGDADKLGRAKKILINGVIGLVLIMASFSIAHFVVNQLSGAIGGTVSTSGSCGDGVCSAGETAGSCPADCAGGPPDSGSRVEFTLSSWNDFCALAVQNLQLQFVFTKNVNGPSVDAGGVIVRDVSSGTTVPGTFTTTGKRVTFTPSQDCGPSAPGEKCFASDTDYSISIDPNVLMDTSRQRATCTGGCFFSFTTGSAIDLVAPVMSMSAPNDGQSVYEDVIEPLQALAQDDVGVAAVDFQVDGSTVYQAGGADATQAPVPPYTATDFYFNTDTSEWDASSYTTNRTHTIRAIGYDCSGRSAVSSAIRVTVRALTCHDGVVNNGEDELPPVGNGPDCGGPSSGDAYCGSCTGASCNVDADCASGSCVNGFCTNLPIISRVTPGDGAVGNLITLSGTQFGTAGGTIVFDPDGAAIAVPAYDCGSGPQWSDLQVVVEVPSGFVGGPIELIRADDAAASPRRDRTDDAAGPYIQDFNVNAVVRPGICLVNPSTSPVQSPIVVQGKGFGATPATSLLWIGNYNAVISTWSAAQIDAGVPTIPPRRYNVQVFVGDNTCSADASITCVTDAECVAASAGVCQFNRQGSNPVALDVFAAGGSGTPVISELQTSQNACSANGPMICASDVDCGSGSCLPSGPIGEYVTLIGTGFGSVPGTVRLQNTTTNDIALADVVFPAQCSTNYWKDIQVLVKVPRTYENDAPVIAGDHEIYLRRGSGALVDSNRVPFVVVDNRPAGPGICALDPSAGPVGTEVDVYGDNLGAADGSVTFSNNLIIDNSAYTSWENQQILDVLVPAGTITGPVFATEPTGGLNSNTLNFQVGDCRTDANLCAAGESCCADGSCSATCSAPVASHYSYIFSTGPLPLIPKVIVQCGLDTFGAKIISPTPWNGWGEQACTNSAIRADFDIDMDTTTLSSSSIEVARCIGTVDPSNPCNVLEPPLAGVATALGPRTISWVPPSPFLPGETYQARLIASNIASAPIPPRQGAKMGVSPQDDFVWEFTVDTTGASCAVGSVSVVPNQQVLKALNEVGSLGANPVAQGLNCTVLDCRPYNYSWTSSNDLNVSLSPPTTGIAACRVSVNALQETAPGFETMTATIDGDGVCSGNASIGCYDNTPCAAASAGTCVSQPFTPVSGTGRVTVDFTDPKVIGVTPNCGSACRNAEIRATFNTAMDASTFDFSTVRLYACGNQLCDQSDPNTILVTTSFMSAVDYQDLGAEHFVRLLFADASNNPLSQNAFYRVVIDGSVTSTSGVALAIAGANNLGGFTGQYSWVFRTKNDSTICSIDRLEVEPEEARARVIGQRVPFLAIPYGAPDSCSPTGQALDAQSFSWGAWTSVDNPDQSPVSPADVAIMLGNPPGALAVSTNVPAYCSPSCLKTGSLIQDNLGRCGDNLVQNGEDCDYGDEIDGDGCSSRCTNEGSARLLSGGTCGDGFLQAGEDCDDGQVCSNGTACSADADCAGIGDSLCAPRAGGGCSALCLNEGSQAASVTCGNGSLDYVPARGGEDCDDGNTRGGDGCSSQCLNEGSIKYSLVSAVGVCGNGGPPEPGEDCDDGNYQNGDGCSSKCLNEGTPACQYVCKDAVGGGSLRACSGLAAVCPGVETCQPLGGACCGNGGPPESGEDCDDGNAFDGDGCSRSCLNEGSNVQYSTASFCGDTVSDVGEECEATGMTSVGPIGVAQVNQTAPLEVDPITRLAKADIGALADSQPGSATLSVECGCQSDSMCHANPSDQPLLGCGTSGCCFPRPTMGLYEPADASVNRCRNTAIYVEFDQDMDPGSFAPSKDTNADGTIDALDQPNLYLELVRVDTDGDQVPDAAGVSNCPANHLRVSVAPTGSWIARAAKAVVRTVAEVFGKTAYAQLAPTRCVVPLTFGERPTSPGERIQLLYPQALEPFADYRVVVLGDANLTDAIDEGALGANGVSIATTSTQINFQTGADICTLDGVDVVDLGRSDVIGPPNYPLPASPNFFTFTSEAHSIVADAYTLHGGATKELISPIPAVAPAPGYDWSWTFGLASAPTPNILSLIQGSGIPAPPSASAVAGTEDGNPVILANATIIDDGFNTPSTVGHRVIGQRPVSVYLCSNPFTYTDDGMLPGDPGPATNFSFTYCLDAGNPLTTADDLPAVRPVVAPNPLGGILKELLFPINGGDGLGVRVVANPEYYPPDVWFEKQGFQGTPTSILLDGYEAIQVGNTVYASAANRRQTFTNNDVLPNIYVISFNANASQMNLDIFAQVLESWRFNSNDTVVTDWNVCRDLNGGLMTDASGVLLACTWDVDCRPTYCHSGTSAVMLDGDGNPITCVEAADCQENDPAGQCLPLDPEAFCDASKAKLRRDTKRLTDLVRMRLTLEHFGFFNGHCSSTRDQACVVDAQCPGTEFCLPNVPELAEGSFIRTMSTSKWPSWSAQLSNALSTALPVDPINAFAGCPDGYDRETCWNATATLFQCDLGSEVYKFQSSGGETYTLTAQLEYGSAPWGTALDASASDNATLKAEYVNYTGPSVTLPNGFFYTSSLCTGQPQGASAICGDGVQSPTETCEVGQSMQVACSGGRQTVACVNDAGLCRWQTPVESQAPCIPFACGNGVIDAQASPPEQCDDGALNGSYGHCGYDCQLSSAFYCGDGFLAGGEQCDCGNVAARAAGLPSGSWATTNGCTNANGIYTASGTSCSFACTTPGPSCGDAEVNGAEVCDSNSETASCGGVCIGGPRNGFECANSASCGGLTWSCPRLGRQFSSQIACVQGCPNGLAECRQVATLGVCQAQASVCEAGDPGKIGHVCTQNFDCGAGPDARCSTSQFTLTHSRQCQTDCSALGTWGVCTAAGQGCGNGVKEGTEQCDDGNQIDADACTNACLVNVCGDGIILSGVESCDEGARNASASDPNACNAPYGGTCSFCTNTCQFRTRSGGFCGDGQLNGNEFCEGNTFTNHCARFEPGQPAVLGGVCGSNASECDPNPSNWVCGVIGACNGGAFHGEPCTTDLDAGRSSGTRGQGCKVNAPDPGSCYMPTCNTNCQGACPFDYQTDQLLIRPELAGAQPEQSVEIYNFESGQSPDNATVIFPACRYGADLYASVNIGQPIPNNTDVIFVTDRSGSMDEAPGDPAQRDPNDGPGTKMFIAKLAIQNSIDELIDYWSQFDAQTSSLNIALVSYSDSARVDSTPPFMPHDDPNSLGALKTAVGAYRSGGGTNTPAAINQALGMFRSRPAGNTKVLILLSDGDPTYGSPKYWGSIQTVKDTNGNQNIFNSGTPMPVDIYTAAITTNSSLIGFMKHLSNDSCNAGDFTAPHNDSKFSNASNCQPNAGIEYAYSGATESAISGMYEQILGSLTEVSFTISSLGINGVVSDAQTVQEGNNIKLPFPSGQVCNGLTGYELPIAIGCPGNCSATIGDIRFTYCPAPLTAGVGSAVCGNGTCEITETRTTCPADCSSSTSACTCLDFNQTGAWGVRTNCGGVITDYQHECVAGGIRRYTCDNATGDAVATDVPCGGFCSGSGATISCFNP